MQITNTKMVLDVIEKLTRSDVCLEIMKNEEYKSVLIDNSKALDRLMRTFTPEQKDIYIKNEHTSSQKYNLEENYIFLKTIQYGVAMNELLAATELTAKEILK